jgi:hypothetical protein
MSLLLKLRQIQSEVSEETVILEDGERAVVL